MKKRSLVILGHATSISMEEEFWQVLKKIAICEKMTIQQLVEKIDIAREGNLSSSLRVYVLNYLLQKLEKDIK